MRNFLLSVALISGLMLPVGPAHPQSTATVTATCKDGTAFTGTKRSGACRGHGGVQSWSEAASPGDAQSPAAQSAENECSGSDRRRPSLGQYRH